MSDDDILYAMDLLGGSFASALAKAWRRADPINQAKLRAAFPELWAEYAAVAELKRKQQEDRA